jgi:hypothetical protein
MCSLDSFDEMTNEPGLFDRLKWIRSYPFGQDRIQKVIWWAGLKAWIAWPILVFLVSGVFWLVVPGLLSRRQTAVVLDCSAQEILHILRIQGDGQFAEDLSFNPPHTGTANVTDAGYVLRFSVVPAAGQLLFRINRFTGDGTREIIDQDGKTIVGHGGFDRISCKPYTDKPF